MCLTNDDNINSKIFDYHKHQNLKKIIKFYDNKILIDVKNDYFKFHNINVDKCFNKKIVNNVNFSMNQCDVIIFAFVKYVYKNNNIFASIMLFDI